MNIQDEHTLKKKLNCDVRITNYLFIQICQVSVHLLH